MSVQKTARKTVSFGDLVTMAFEVAASYSDDPQEVSQIAASALENILRTHRCAPPAPQALPDPSRRQSTRGRAKAQRHGLLARAA